MKLFSRVLRVWALCSALFVALQSYLCCPAAIQHWTFRFSEVIYFKWIEITYIGNTIFIKMLFLTNVTLSRTYFREYELY
jgi:hypothetical protein